MPQRTYLEPYRQAHATHGHAFEVTLWASRRTQELRFAVFTEMCFLAGKRLLDVGCARGDLAAYLLTRQIPFSHYTGIDALENVVAFARQRPEFQGQPVEFHAGDVLTHPELLRTGRPQVICISGTLNTMDDAHVRQLLQTAWEATAEVLLFNFLSDRCDARAPRQEPPVRRLNLLGLLDWALTQTPLVSLRQDYFPHGHDATLCLRK